MDYQRSANQPYNGAAKPNNALLITMSDIISPCAKPRCCSSVNGTKVKKIGANKCECVCPTLAKPAAISDLEIFSFILNRQSRKLETICIVVRNIPSLRYPQSAFLALFYNWSLYSFHLDAAHSKPPISRLPLHQVLVKCWQKKSNYRIKWT